MHLEISDMIAKIDSRIDQVLEDIRTKYQAALFKIPTQQKRRKKKSDQKPSDVELDILNTVDFNFSNSHSSGSQDLKIPNTGRD